MPSRGSRSVEKKASCENFQDSLGDFSQCFSLLLWSFFINLPGIWQNTPVSFKQPRLGSLTYNGKHATTHMSY